MPCAHSGALGNTPKPHNGGHIYSGKSRNRFLATFNGREGGARLPQQVIPPLEAPRNQVNPDWLDVRAAVEDWSVWYGESNSKYWIEKGAEQRG